MQLYTGLLQHNTTETQATHTAGRLQAMSAVPLFESKQTMNKLIQSLVVAGLMATAGGVAIAQAGGMMGHDGMGHGDSAKIAQMHAKHLSSLKAKLKITATQEAAWTSFADSMKPAGGMMGKHPDPAEMDKMSTPERIDKMRALHKERMSAMEAAMDKRGDATKTFYASLSPEQKKVFDDEFSKMGRRGEHGKRGHMMGSDSAKPTAPAKP